MKHPNRFSFSLLCVSVLLCSASMCDKNGNPSGGTSVSVTPSSIDFDSSGGTKELHVTATADWSVSGPSWISFSSDSGKGTGRSLKINITAAPNDSAARDGATRVLTKDGKFAECAVHQAAKSDKPLSECRTFAICANSMVYYGGLVKGTGLTSGDKGMFYKLMKTYGIETTVYNCTQGGHYLRDFLPEGCRNTDKSCYKKDHMAGVPFDKIDCIIISEAGTNTSDFLSAARGIVRRVSEKNPGVKKIYINHVYSVYKKHNIILNGLKTLHDEDGFTIINCGQLAYDVYTGAVNVPGGTLKYSDRYTFCNHTDSDTYHPNPLMGYIMTQMLCCAITGNDAFCTDYSSLIKGCTFSSGKVSYSDYYNKYYTNPAALPFMAVIDNPGEMKGIQQLIPRYINKF